MANFDKGAFVDVAQTSHIDLTFESIGTMQMGLAYPVLHKTIVPKDEFTLTINDIMRLAPMQSPVFDDLSLHFRAFFVPNRVLDPRWKEFITGGVGLYGSSENEIDNLSFTPRSLVSYNDFELSPLSGGVARSTAGLGSLADWLNFHFAGYNGAGDPCYGVSEDGMGIEEEVLTYANTSSKHFDILPFLGYWKIYDDWYRNERVQPEMLPDMINHFTQLSTRVWDENDARTERPDSVCPFRLFRVNYGKDRYTTALPEPTIGGDVTYLNGDAEVRSTQAINTLNNTYPVGTVNADAPGDQVFSYNGTSKPALLYASLASAVQATIQNLKASFKVYDFFMKDTYGGNRYVEFIQNHFDVTVPDATLDRAIYLGDTKVRVSFGEVFQTSQGDGSSDSGVLGDYSGRGAAYVQDGYMFKSFFREHGQLYVIASIVPRAKYFQGIDRKFFKGGRFSYFFPEFQNIGDDSLYTSELFNSGFHTDDQEKIFGFNARWIDLKESLDEVHGDFLNTMNDYHFGRYFIEDPQIGTTFSKVPTNNRPFSVTDSFSANYLLNMQFVLKAQRPIMLHESF